MSQSLLSAAERLRYQRQMTLPELGLAGQERLKRARVLVVGAGGLGCPVLLYLVAAGVGTIKIADADRVDQTNLHRQPLFEEATIGCLKVEEALRVLKARNAAVELVPLAYRVEPENVREVMADVEIVVDGSDNFATKYLLNDAAVELGKSLVSGSIFCFEGQVSVFNAALSSGQRGPTYRCLFPEPPPPDLVPSCAEAGVLGVLPGVVGALQATETLKLVLGLEGGLTGRLLVFDALSMCFSEVTFQRNAETAARTRIQPPGYYHALAARCSTNVPHISAAELRRRLEQDDDLVLIDVREPHEKAELDLGGELIPVGVLCANSHRIPRDRTVVLYCRSGARSQRGIAMLRSELGFTNLVNLEGGVNGWLLLVAGQCTSTPQAP